MNERISKSALPSPAALAVVVLCAIGAPAAYAQAQAAAAAPVRWTKTSVDLPASDAILPGGDAAQTANGYCLMCHSAGMVLRQPPLAQAQWLAEIQKMRAFWGSPLPVEQEPALAAYLAGINGPNAAQPASANAKRK